MENLLKPMMLMNNMIETLNENQIFVFGSNMKGAHNGGAAKLAKNKFGAIDGHAYGMQGKSFAIPTLDENYKKLPLKEIKHYLIRFRIEAVNNPKLEFLLTPIGTGIAGFSLDEIKSILPIFSANVILVGNWE